MRKVKLQMQTTLDGYVARPDGQMDWMSVEMDPKQLTVLQELTESMDTILLGRKMSEGFTTYWENVVNNQPDSPEYSYAKIFVDTPKIVFSKTVSQLKGKNVMVENGDAAAAITKLKSQPGKDIIVYGGAGLAGELIKLNLIDEINLFVNPVAIGTGLPVFQSDCRLKLVKSMPFDNGVVFNRYSPVKA